MKVLVLGGTGFIGRHAVLALLARGAEVAVGTRRPARAHRKLPAAARACELRRVRFELLTRPGSWDSALQGIDVVVNCVGILRERGAETYERVHHLAPAALAADCARRGVARLIHVSALGLHADARSAFITSKLRGEGAVKTSRTDWSIVRPSLLDGPGGHGARWLRMVARWPVHFAPAEARGRIAALDVGELGEAIAALCAARERADLREVELGGGALRTMREHLAALRRASGRAPAPCVAVPAWIARPASHLCDLLHFSPFSFGHLELMRRDNAPAPNLLPRLLGRAPKAIGADAEPENWRSAYPGAILSKYGNLKLGDARTLFFLENGLPSDGGDAETRWSARFGKLELSFPNFRWRRRAVPCHDLHHILTEYECSPAGEVETAAWEFAAGRFPHAAATLFCLPLVAAGAVFWPARTFRAFLRGRRSHTLYGAPITPELLRTRVSTLREKMLPVAPPRASHRDLLAYCRLVGAALALAASPAIAAALIWAARTALG